MFIFCPRIARVSQRIITIFGTEAENKTCSCIKFHRSVKEPETGPFFMSDAKLMGKKFKALKRDMFMDELAFYVPSTVFQSFRDDGRVNMKGSVQ